MATTRKSSRGSYGSGFFLRAGQPEDYERILLAFDRDHQAAIEGFLLELVARLREIRLVEFTFSANPVTSEKADGPCNRMEFGQRLADLQAWERGEHRPNRLGSGRWGGFGLSGDWRARGASPGP